MKNKFSGYCYICGEPVEEGEGIAMLREREPGSAGWGKTTWSVRCNNPCSPPTPESIERKAVARDSAEHDAGSEAENVTAD